jgi:hypothetical protein
VLIFTLVIPMALPDLGIFSQFWAHSKEEEARSLACPRKKMSTIIKLFRWPPY